MDVLLGVLTDASSLSLVPDGDFNACGFLGIIGAWDNVCGFFGTRGGGLFDP